MPNGLDYFLDRTTLTFTATPGKLLGLAGTEVFHFDWSAKTSERIAYAVTNVPLTFYEVSAFADGSWWAPTSTEPQDQWEKTDIGPLEANPNDSNVPIANMLRPMSQFWWIEGPAPEDLLAPERLFGRIKGLAPETPPKS